MQQHVSEERLIFIVGIVVQMMMLCLIGGLLREILMVVLSVMRWSTDLQLLVTEMIDYSGVICS